MSLEKQIKDAWRAYRYNSESCHEIANRVKNRRILGMTYGYALPGETDEYDRRARSLRQIEEYIAVRQKEYNRQHPNHKSEDYKFNLQIRERTLNELANHN